VSSTQLHLLHANRGIAFFSRGGSWRRFFSAAVSPDLHGGASARFILAVTVVAVCNGIEASRHGAEPSAVDSPWRAVVWLLARIYTIP
jgi:hypothetical protein